MIRISNLKRLDHIKKAIKFLKKCSGRSIEEWSTSFLDFVHRATYEAKTSKFHEIAQFLETNFEQEVKELIKNQKKSPKFSLQK